MDIQQTVDLTYVKVDEIDRKLNNIEFGGTEGSNTDSKLNNLKTICENTATKEDITTKTNLVMGEDNVDLTEINEKLTQLASYLGKNPYPEEFTADPYKLDEEFTGYTPGETVFNTTDFVECTKPYILNEEGRNFYYNISFLGIYCEGETFDAKVIVDCETNVDNAKICIVFPDTTVGSTTTNNKEINLTNGRNLIAETIEGVNVSTNGNYLVLKVINGDKSIINSFKIEVTGKNIAILSKPKPFKVFCKYDEVIISKLENYNAYTLKMRINELNPGTLKQSYTLVKENVRDFEEILGTIKVNSKTSKGIYCRTFLTLDGQKYDEYGDYNVCTYMLNISGNGQICTLIDIAHNFRFIYTTFLNYYSDNTLTLDYYLSGYDSVTDAGYLGASKNTIANFTFIHDITNYNMTNKPITTILTFKNGISYLFIKLASTSEKVNLGIGKNITAYFDKDNKDLIYVYMRVGAKMVKKTVQLSTITNEDGTTTPFGEIIEQKIIGTYDYYFETQSNKYLVVKENKIYTFKK